MKPPPENTLNVEKTIIRVPRRNLSLGLSLSNTEATNTTKPQTIPNGKKNQSIVPKKGIIYIMCPWEISSKAIGFNMARIKIRTAEAERIRIPEARDNA